MAKCCRCSSASAAAPAGAVRSPAEWFQNMLPNCLEQAAAAKAAGRPVVGILCEFAPRELILAAGGLPVCLCGGSAKTIATAEEHLPVNLCPLIKSTYGFHLQRSNPLLEMADLVVGETTCDGKKKMYELMAETRPMYVMELPQKPHDPDALEHWVREMEKFRGFLETRFNVRITDGQIRQAIGLMNRERRLRRELAGLMRAESPPLSGRQLLDFKSSISGIPADLEQYEKALAVYRADGSSAGWLGHSEAVPQQTAPGAPLARLAMPQPPIAMPQPPSQAGQQFGSRVRVLLTGVPLVRGAERVLEIIEDHGGLVVCMENCTGLKPILEDVDAEASDPMRALAEKYFRLPCPVMTRNDRRLETLRTLAAEYRVECVVELIWQACLIYDVESYRVRRLAEQELHLPYLRIETDYSPSDSARIALRVEALLETVRAGQPAG